VGVSRQSVLFDFPDDYFADKGHPQSQHTREHGKYGTYSEDNFFVLSIFTTIKMRVYFTHELPLSADYYGSLFLTTEKISYF